MIAKRITNRQSVGSLKNKIRENCMISDMVTHAKSRSGKSQSVLTQYFHIDAPCHVKSQLAFILSDIQGSVKMNCTPKVRQYDKL